jgi:hypothetical protein
MRRSALAALVIVLALAVCACGGNKKPGTAGMDTSAADRAKAQQLVLNASDMPPGWTGVPPSPDPEGDVQSKALAACAGAVDPSVATSAEVEGQSFSKDTADVSSDVTIVKTTQHAQTDLAAITGPAFESCAEDAASDLLKAQFERSGATLESFSFDPISTERYGDATNAFRLATTVATGDQRATLYVDLIFILKGRAEVTVSFTNVGKPFDEALKRSLLAKMGAKLAAA